jgi:hypothetical protein
VGVIGANGCGKTTLFNVLSGRVSPDAGSIEVGPTVKLGLVSQLRDELDDNKTVYQEIAQSEDFITVGGWRWVVGVGDGVLGGGGGGGGLFCLVVLLDGFSFFCNVSV